MITKLFFDINIVSLSIWQTFSTLKNNFAAFDREGQRCMQVMILQPCIDLDFFSGTELKLDSPI